MQNQRCESGGFVAGWIELLSLLHGSERSVSLALCEKTVSARKSCPYAEASAASALVDCEATNCQRPSRFNIKCA